MFSILLCFLIILVFSIHYSFINLIAPNIFVSIWISINILVAVYQYFISSYRHRLSRSYCLNPYVNVWTRKDMKIYSKEFWLQAWTDYACVCDSRFLIPNSFVYAIIIVNVLIVVGMIMVLVGGMKIDYLWYLLVLQFINALFYVGSLAVHYIKTRDSFISLKKVGCLGLVAMWIIVPVVLLIVSQVSLRALLVP